MSKHKKSKKQPIICRQGDILFVRTDSVPTEGINVERQAGHIVVALGEATGHSHSIQTETVVMYRSDVLEREWIVAPEGAEVVHQEHDTLQLPAGMYWIVRQRQYARGKVYRVFD